MYGVTFLTEKEGFEPSRRVNDLLPFQGSPFSLLGTSPNRCPLGTACVICFADQLLILKDKIKRDFFPLSGEDGIRTHVAVKPNGFQDRPVMTASVPLQIGGGLYATTAGCKPLPFGQRLRDLLRRSARFCGIYSPCSLASQISFCCAKCD